MTHNQSDNGGRTRVLARTSAQNVTHFIRRRRPGLNGHEPLEILCAAGAGQLEVEPAGSAVLGGDQVWCHAAMYGVGVE